MRIIITLFIILFLRLRIHQLKGNSLKYRSECVQRFDIEIIKPKGFKTIGKMVPFKVNEGRSIGSFYRVALESGNKDCLILYPFFTENRPRGIAKIWLMVK